MSDHMIYTCYYEKSFLNKRDRSVHEVDETLAMWKPCTVKISVDFTEK